MPRRIEQNVLWFQIAVDNGSTMQRLHTEQHLSGEETCRRHGQRTTSGQDTVQVSS